ncbi:TonB-dependent receptor [Steroidobacter sp.]|uniref:TonB-dependent receptor n=1 Tax=Steroidobacter sp. TaxID=1978227 RepID=UPI001A4C103D|nr:TonB-dependent receptor [Steroidobacter sp.]MBL8267983.1 TonB-dependent receptor [Steroidobacter sp.]
MLALALTMLSATGRAGEPLAHKRIAFDISRQRADQALIEFAEQADVTFMFPFEVSQNRTANRVVGTYTVAEAITLLLRDTGLAAEFGVDGALTVSKGSSVPAFRRADHTTRDGTMIDSNKQKISFLARLTGAMGALFSVGAGAQSTDSETTQVQPTVVEEVVVASSRISREGFTAPTPTTVIGAEELQNNAIVNVADLLNEAPAFSGSVTPSTTVVNSQNAGGNFLNLRGLGSARTLVLLNGRRHVPTRVTGSEVDINVIPSALLERVEVVTGGASAAWGSDAVAGVVNMVLRSDVNGFEGKLQTGISDRGDNEENLGTLAFGTGFADGRGHFTAAAEIARSEGVSPQTSRDWAKPAWGIIANPAYAAGNGEYRQLIVSGYGMSNGALGGLITSGPLRGTQFGVGGVPIPFTYGTFVPGSSFMAGGDGVWLGQNIAIKIPVDRENVFSTAHFDINDNLRVFAEASFAHSQTYSDLVPTYSLGATTIYRDNAFLPESIRDQMQTLGLNSFSLGRFDYDLPMIVTDIETSTRRGVFGVEGKVGEWEWELAYQYGRSHYDSKLHGNRIRANYALATDAVLDTATGRIVCRSTLTNPSNGCQPMNVFGVGSPSPESVAYTTATQWLDAYYTQRAFDFSAQGPLFNTWAGQASAAFGAGYRKDELTSAVDALSASSAYIIGNPTANAGSFDVKELFAEVAVPLLSERAWNKSLELNGAFRRTDYNLSGEVTTWKVGLSWEISDQVRLRGTRSRDIRAPNLSELYTPYQLSLGTIIDRVSNVQANTYFITTGNPNLDPEEADTTTFGIVYQPYWASGLRTSIDFYDIEVSGAISTISGQNIVDRCQAGNASLCSLITRDGSGVITQIALSPVNLSKLTTRGVDFELSYDLPLAALDLPGRLGLRLLATYVDELATSDGITNIDRAGDVGSGHGGVPHWKAQAGLTYSLAPFVATLDGRYIGGGKFDNTYGQYDINDNTIGSVFYLDTALRYQLDAAGRMEVYGRIQNLLDKDPPINVFNFSQSMATNFALYDVIGRSYVAGVRFKF